MYNDSCWVVNCSDGSSHVEKWIAGELSPWRRLMLYCQANNVYITNLRMTVGTQTVGCPSGAVGYWQSNAMPAVQGIECDEELHKWHGIGWVQDGMVNIIWGAMDPKSHDVMFWQDHRDPANQGQIIWSNNPKFVLRPESQVVDTPVANVKEYSQMIEVSEKD